MKDKAMNVRFKTRQEIAVELGIHRDTLRKLLAVNDLSIPTGLIAPKDQQRIYSLFGNPVEAARKVSFMGHEKSLNIA